MILTKENRGAEDRDCNYLDPSKVVAEFDIKMNAS
jgi:hypothetical protein